MAKKTKQTAAKSERSRKKVASSAPTIPLTQIQRLLKKGAGQTSRASRKDGKKVRKSDPYQIGQNAQNTAHAGLIAFMDKFSKGVLERLGDAKTVKYRSSSGNKQMRDTLSHFPSLGISTDAVFSHERNHDDGVSEAAGVRLFKKGSSTKNRFAISATVKKFACNLIDAYLVRLGELAATYAAASTHKATIKASNISAALAIMNVTN